MRKYDMRRYEKNDRYRWKTKSRVSSSKEKRALIVAVLAFPAIRYPENRRARIAAALCVRYSLRGCWMHLAALQRRASQGKMRPMRHDAESIFRFSALSALLTLVIILASAHVTLKLPIITWVCVAGLGKEVRRMRMKKMLQTHYLERSEVLGRPRNQ